MRKGGGRVPRKGRLPERAAREEVAGWLGAEPGGRDRLLGNLHAINDREGRLSRRRLVALADLSRLSMAEVYETASFYHGFDVGGDGADAPALPKVRVCESVSCWMAGSDSLRQALAERLAGKATVRPVACLGRCAGAPALLAGRRAMENPTVDAVAAAVEAGDLGPEPTRHVSLEAYRESGGYGTHRRCVDGEIGPEEAIAAVERSGLRGLGGAGFPAGRKWRIVREQPAPRALAVNIDESEPGTFKDRHFLESDPHRFVEGALIAAWAVDAAEIHVYLRDEYHGCRAMLEGELALLRRWLGGGIPPIRLHRGAGAYICGEESAMLESMEGRRGMPRLRPPYIAQVGLFGRPTLEHNMETLHWVRDIIERGPDEFAAGGLNGRSGRRSFSVSGRVRRPGVHVAPAGITLRELVDGPCGGMADGHRLRGYLPGGASGGMLPASMADVPLDFDTLQERDPDCFIGSAAVIVFSDRDSPRDIALNVMRFFEDESCGKCTPCRVGTAKAVRLMGKARWDVPLLSELSATMADASICGLGQAAPNVVKCLLRHFPEEVPS